MARVPDAKREDFPEKLQYVWDAVAEGREPPNIFKAMGNNPHVLLAYLRLVNGLWNHCGLDLQTRELVILRSAMNSQSRYEWHQHVRIGRDAGLSDDQILALQSWKDSDAFDQQEKTLFAYVDQFAGDGVPSQESHDAMAAAFGESTTAAVAILVPFYQMTARFLAAMDVQPEEPFVGWALEG